MKKISKNTKKSMTLNKQTVKLLTGQLAHVAGGTTTVPSGDSECTYCLSLACGPFNQEG